MDSDEEHVYIHFSPGLGPGHGPVHGPVHGPGPGSGPAPAPGPVHGPGPSQIFCSWADQDNLQPQYCGTEPQ